MSVEEETNAKPKAVAEIVADLRKAALLGTPIDPAKVADQIENAFGRLEDWWHRAVGKGGIYYTPPEVMEIVNQQNQEKNDDSL